MALIKPEVGVKYKLVDKTGYFEKSEINIRYYERYFDKENDTICFYTIISDDGDDSLFYCYSQDGVEIVSSYELEFFEEYEEDNNVLNDDTISAIEELEGINQIPVEMEDAVEEPLNVTATTNNTTPKPGNVLNLVEKIEKAAKTLSKSVQKSLPPLKDFIEIHGDMNEEEIDQFFSNLDPVTDVIKQGTKVFGEMGREDVYCLIDYYLGSCIIQEKFNPENKWVDMNFNYGLCFNINYYYRIKPEVK